MIGASSSTTCNICNAGTYSASGSSACLVCKAGTYSSIVQATSCISCNAGMWSTVLGSNNENECQDCDAGTFSSAGASSCTPCAAGTYSSVSLASSCTKCNAGTWSNVSGATSKSVCQTTNAGSWSYEAAVQFTFCNAGTWSSTVAATSQSACLSCNAGTWSLAVGASIAGQCLTQTYIYPTPSFGISRPGGNLPNMPVYLPPESSYTACQLLCQNNPLCVAWEYGIISGSCGAGTKPSCALKGSNPSSFSDACFISAARFEGAFSMPVPSFGVNLIGGALYGTYPPSFSFGSDYTACMLLCQQSPADCVGWALVQDAGSCLGAPNAGPVCTLLSSISSTSSDSCYTSAAINSSPSFCELSFGGGSFVLVRHTPPGLWHLATDSLGGASVYGFYNATSSITTTASAFSVPFASFVSALTTAMIVTGDRVHWVADTLGNLRSCCGTRSMLPIGTSSSGDYWIKNSALAPAPAIYVDADELSIDEPIYYEGGSSAMLAGLNFHQGSNVYVFNAAVCPAVCPGGCATGFCTSYGTCSLQCAAGFRMDDSQTVCLVCNAGTWSAAGASSCTRCNTGTWSSVPGANSVTMCIGCTAGTWSSVVASTSVSTCIACNAGTYSSVVSLFQNTCLGCSAGNFSTTIGAPTKSHCRQCSAGTYSPVQSAACLPCEAGFYTASSETALCRPWTVCSDGFMAINTPSASVDRICQEIDACQDFPCSLFSSGCTDLAPPAGNAVSGRRCGPCKTGYTAVNNGYNGTCLNNLLVPPVCACLSESSWVTTACELDDSQLCPSGAGFRTRRCDALGNWQLPDESSCAIAGSEPDVCTLTPCDANAQFCHVTSQLGGGASTRTCGPCRSGFQLVGETCVDIQLRDISQENIAFGNVDAFAADTAFIAVNRSQNSLGISQLVNVTNKIVQVDAAAGAIPSSVIDNVALIINDLLDTSKENIVEAYEVTENADFPDNVDDFAAARAAELPVNTSRSSVHPNLMILTANLLQFNGYNASLNNVTKDFVRVPAGLAPILPQNVSVSVVYYKTSLLFPSSKAVGSPVVSLSVSGIVSGQLFNPPVEITFQVQSGSPSTTYTCAYFDFEVHDWETDGCQMASSATINGSFVIVCHCSHLTSFGILLDSQGRDSALSSQHRVALHVITYVGCSISIFLMLVVLIVFTVFVELQTRAKNVIRHLCLCLILSQLLFLTAIDQTSLHPGCSIIALALQFFLLSAFMWMLREAVILYESFVTVFGGMHIRWKRTLVICYGVPALIVAISAGIRWSDYGTTEHCWLSTQHGTIWAFIAPVLLIISLNAYVFICVMVAIFKSETRDFRRSSSTETDSKLANLKKAMRASLSFLCLLGVTWVFGALAIGDASVTFFYLFAICNCIQGVMIFFFQLALDRTARLRVLKAMHMRSSSNNSGHLVGNNLFLVARPRTLVRPPISPSPLPSTPKVSTPSPSTPKLSAPSNTKASVPSNPRLVRELEIVDGPAEPLLSEAADHSLASIEQNVVISRLVLDGRNSVASASEDADRSLKNEAYMNVSSTTAWEPSAAVMYIDDSVQLPPASKKKEPLSRRNSSIKLKGASTTSSIVDESEFISKEEVVDLSYEYTDVNENIDG